MIYLDDPSKSLQVKLDSVITTNQAQITAYYYDVTSQATTSVRRGGVQIATTNSTTLVTMATAPAMQGIIRNIHTIIINNKDTVSHVVTVQLIDSSTNPILVSQALDAGASLVYEDNRGWDVLSPITAPFVDTTEIVKGSLDATKRLRVEVDGITTGTTRVWTVADANIVVGGSAAALTAGRVVYSDTGGLLNASANLTWSGSGTLALTGAATISSTLGVTGTTTLGVTNTGALSATTGSFSSTLGVTGTSTLGVTNTGAFTATTGSFSSTLAVTGHTTFEGVTSTGATGTGNLVYSASPTLTGTLTGAAANFSGAVATAFLNATVASGTAIEAIRSAGGDRLRINPLAANSGASLDVVNSAESDYQPFGVYGNGITLNSRNGVGTTVQVASFTSGATSLTGTLGVSGATTLSSTLAVTGLSTFSSDLKRSDGTNFGYFGLTGANAYVQGITATNTAIPVLVYSGSTQIATFNTSGLTINNSLALTAYGVSSTGATGTGNLVFSASPTLTGTLSAAAVTLSGLLTAPSPTFTGTITAAAANFSGVVTGSSAISGALTASGATTIPFLANGQTTGASYIQIQNTSGNFIAGVATSVGGPIGGAGYEAFVGSNAAKDFVLLTNAAISAKIPYVASPTNYLKLIASAGGAPQLDTNAGTLNLASAGSVVMTLSANSITSNSGSGLWAHTGTFQATQQVGTSLGAAANSGGFAVGRRDTGGLAFLIYSSAGNVQFYNGATDVASLTSGGVFTSASYDMANGGLYEARGTSNTVHGFFDANTASAVMRLYGETAHDWVIYRNTTEELRIGSGRVTVANNLTVSGTGPHAIGGGANSNYQLLMQGAFSSGSTEAAALYIATSITPVVGNNAFGQVIIPTLNKGGSGTHSNFDSLAIFAPTIGAGAAALTNATTLHIYSAPSVGTNRRAFWIESGQTTTQDLTVASGSFIVSGTGPHAIGGATSADVQLNLTGTLSGAATNATAFAILSTLNPPVNGVGHTQFIGGTINKAGSGTHADFNSLEVQPPAIGAGAATLTNATTLKITGAPSVGTNQRALWVAAGLTQLDGATTLGAALTYGGVTLSNAVTGTGNMVLSTSPSLTTPVLGTPTSGTLTNCTGLPLTTGITGTLPVGNGGTGVTTSTGTGNVVLSSSPTLTTPVFSGVPTGTVTSSSYTPTLTNTSNIDASTAYTTYYFRVGDMIHVFGQVAIDVTTGTTITDMGMSLPIASTLTNAYDLVGDGHRDSIASTSGPHITIRADTTNNRARFWFYCDAVTTNQTYFFNFTYKVA